MVRSCYRRLHLAHLVLPALLLAAGPARAERLVTLQDAYRLAVRNHPTIEILQARVSQAKAARYRAWTALQPTANIQGSFTRFDEEIALELGPLAPQGDGRVVIQKQNQFSYSAMVNLPLFRGPAYPGIAIAGKQVEIARLSEIRSRRDFLLQIARSYYQVVSQKEVVVALNNQVQVDEKHLVAARAQFEVGQAPRSTVLRAELVAVQNRQSLRVQTNTLQAARRQLAILLGIDEAVDVKRPPEPPEVTRGGLPPMDRALERREDYEAALLGVEVAEDSKDAVWWQFAPFLDASWSYRWSEAAGFAGDKDTWQLMFTLGLPIYDAGVRYADLKATRARLREAAAQRKSLGLQIESDVVQLHAEVQSANAGVVSAQKAVELARTTAADMEASFEAGVATQLDVLDANQRLLDAELQLTRSLYSRELARLALAHALGTFDPIKS